MQICSAACQNDPGISADEGRAHQAHDDQNVDQLFAGNIIAGQQIGNGNTDEGGGQHGGSADHDGTDQGLVVIGLAEETDEVIKCHAFHFIGENTLGDDVVEGVDNEQTHGDNDSNSHKEPEVRSPFLTESLLHLESTSPVSATYRLTRLGSKLT